MSNPMSDTTPTQQQQAERQTYTIKPLAWELWATNTWFGRSDLGDYVTSSSGGWHWSGCGQTRTPAKSFDAAKAAAEQHYRNRMLACLTPFTPEATDPAPAAPAPQQLDAAKPSAAPASVHTKSMIVESNGLEVTLRPGNDADESWAKQQAAPASEGGDVVERAAKYVEAINMGGDDEGDANGDGPLCRVCDQLITGIPIGGDIPPLCYECESEAASLLPDVYAKLVEQAETIDKLLAVMELLLVEVEPLRSARREAIDAACVKTEEWAKRAKALARDGEPWCFHAEYRATLERELEPLNIAIKNANEAYDSVRAALASAASSVTTKQED